MSRGEVMVDVGTLIVEECCNCGIRFALPEGLRDRALKNHSIQFYCPNGHGQHYTGKTEAQKLRDELEQAQRATILATNSRDNAWRATSAANERTEKERRSKAAIRGHLTRMRNKIANGVCPVGNCRRHFTNVHEHLEHEHAGWLAEHDLLIEQA